MQKLGFRGAAMASAILFIINRNCLDATNDKTDVMEMPFGHILHKTL
jgi:hypothetical protein